jgi:hypothetical protein
MSNKKCGHLAPCGCSDVALTTAAPCNPIDCPDPIVCSEVLNAQCVIYTGPDIMCGEVVLVPSNTSMSNALQLIVNFACAEFATPRD